MAYHTVYAAPGSRQDVWMLIVTGCPGAGWAPRRRGGGATRYSFGDYVLDTLRRELHHAGAPIKLRRKVFQVLVYLLAHRDRAVSRPELLAQLWPDQFIGEEPLTSCAKTLRQALGEHRPADEAPHALPLTHDMMC